MTLDEIKEIAYTFPEQIEICWDKLDSDPKYKNDFESVVSNALKMLPELEGIYTKLTNGQNVVIREFPNEDTSLNHEQKEEYISLVEEELFAGYQMQLMWDTYKKVINITKGGA